MAIESPARRPRGPTFFGRAATTGVVWIVVTTLVATIAAFATIGAATHGFERYVTLVEARKTARETIVSVLERENAARMQSDGRSSINFERLAASTASESVLHARLAKAVAAIGLPETQTYFDAYARHRVRRPFAPDAVRSDLVALTLIFGKAAKETIAATEWQIGLTSLFAVISTLLVGLVSLRIEQLHRAEELRMRDDLVRKAEDLARSNEALQEFAYVASHDLQEPLRMISSYMQLLSKRYDARLDDDGREFIAYAVDGAKRMQALVEDLLSYSRVGTQGAAFARIDANDVVATVLQNLAVQIEESGARIDVANLPYVYADRAQLTSIFQNLVANSLKYRGQGAPVIGISCGTRGARFVFTVSDNGIGIAPQYFERIFRMFARLHTREKYTGTGIGLAITKRMVECHRGSINLESQPGLGSRFSFDIAAAA
ncbi:MAG: hypothetical protein NVS3B16_12590 [Vulcanimicrobiaceae bacterium]